MTVTEQAYAKINLFLDVTGRREDGFHDIFSVMQSVSLCDTLKITAESSDQTIIDITVNDLSIPTDERNLVYRSALKYLTFFQINAIVHVDVDKRIPIGAGLGGGSSDAAATLRGLNNIFGAASREELLQISAELGSDVPFCLIGGRALCTGRGENVYSLRAAPERHLVIAIGESRISTPKAYLALDKLFNNFECYGGFIQSEKNLFDFISNYEANVPLYNIFEKVTSLGDVDKIKETMAKNEAEGVLMSGSGPSVFGIFSDNDTAMHAKKELRDLGFIAHCCHTL